MPQTGMLFTSGFSFDGDISEGQMKLTIDALDVLLAGDWTIMWGPPVPTTTQPLSACLTKETWQKALQKKESLPADLKGTLALSQMWQADETFDLLVSLDGRSLREKADFGYTFASFSPDGNRITFTRGPAGLIGAPGPYNVIIVNADGTDFHQLTFGDGTNLATSWMPDSTHIVCVVRNGLEGASVRMLDIGTGKSSQLFETNYGYGSVVISPDKKRAAYEDWLTGEIYALFVYNLDGLDRRLLAQGNEVVVTIPKWSPDGKWVIASAHIDNLNSRLVLIQPDTCQIIPLPTLNGYVGSWLP